MQSCSTKTAYRRMLGGLQADDRRIAEAHYKLALALHFLEEPEKALQHARRAVAVCNDRIARLSAHPGGAGAAAGPPADDVSCSHAMRRFCFALMRSSTPEHALKIQWQRGANAAHTCNVLRLRPSDSSPCESGL